MTAVASSVFTAAQFNQFVRDNLNETAPAKATTQGSIFVGTGVNSIAERHPFGDFVSTAETTTSTSYTDLSTSGPSLTRDTGASAIIIVGGILRNSSAGGICFMGVTISGASAIAANDAAAFQVESTASDDRVGASFVDFRTGLTPGSNVFTAKYRVTAGTGTFSSRRVDIIPL
jgi:hypothetical protein